ncbi:6-bladed beta-propeller [Pararhodonellum marinum]|uniref:6-bladed beta-propeller n=1 Tax=Pararhodonellum marinum TaxID=2755358 RepID=UPI00188E76EB|nr:6-bladed beta-propeller [Pararhodonellum marinum]
MAIENYTGPIPIKVYEKSNELRPLLKNIEVVYLNDKGDNRIRMVEKAIQVDSLYIFLDRMLGNGFHIYTLEGQPIHTIKRIGEGPGEYKNIANIYYQESTKELVTIPMDGQQKIFFDLSGNFLRDERYNHGYYYSDLHFLENKEFVINLSDMNGFHNVALLQQEKTIQTYLEYAGTIDDGTFNRINLISPENEKILNFVVGFRDTIYQYNIQEELFSAAYFLDFQRDGLDLEKMVEKYGDLLPYFQQDEKFESNPFNLFQNEKFISFGTIKRTGFELYFYDKEKKMVTSGSDLFRETFEYGKVDRLIGVTNDGQFMAIVEPLRPKPWRFKNLPEAQAKLESFGIFDPEDKVLILFDLQ